MAQALRTNDEYNGHEIVIERPNGERLTALAHANPVRDHAGKLIGAVNILVDITAQKRVQATLESMQAKLREADRRKDEFLATLAHELRNPLAPLRNGLYLLPKVRHDDAEFEETRRMMQTQLHHMVHLLDDLLDISRIGRNKVQLRKERVELAWIINDAVEACRPIIDEREHELTVTLPPETVLLDADSVRMAQVVSNLLNNAAKYTDLGGTISVAAEFVPGKGSKPLGEVIVRVRDTGLGIPADMLPHIFDLFVQSDHNASHAGGGLGIGLSLVKSLVELHGGRVEAHSDGPDQGSEFVIRLPASAGLAAERPREATPRRDVTSPQRILVVDDNRAAADSMARVLRTYDHVVRVAFDGPQAIAAAQEFQPDAALLDLGLPGMDGHELARALRALPVGDRLTLIAMTGWGREEDRQRSLAAGFDAHLVKPVKMSAVCELLASKPEEKA